MPRKQTPVSVCTADTMNTVRSRRLLKVLFDTGLAKTLINRRALPRNIVTRKLSDTKVLKTIMGKTSVNEMVHLRDLRLPEFDRHRRIDQQKALVFDYPSRYDIIFGSDFLRKAGIKLNYDTGFMEWYDCILPLRDPHGLTEEEFMHMAESFHVQEDDDFFGEDWLDSFATEILDAKYDKADIPTVIAAQNHLNEQQKKELSEVLQKYTKLFDGTLGEYPHRKIHIELEEEVNGTKVSPVHARAYPVPYIHLETFKKELQHLCELGVLERQGASEWASPSFIIPKKDGRVRWISDLRQLNKVIKRKHNILYQSLMMFYANAKDINSSQSLI